MRRTTLDHPSNLLDTELTSPEAIAARRALADSPHVRSLNAFARALPGRVPLFDPLDGGVEAKLLVLMEAPSRRGAENGFVSFDNPTPTGRRMRTETMAAGLQRMELVVWNVVPWYLGDAKKARNPTLAERRQGVLRLRTLLSLLPNLRATLTLGVAAREGWRDLGLSLPHFAAPHPSNTNLCARPDALIEIRGVLADAANSIHA